MRKLGIFLAVIGLIQSVVLIVNVTSKGLDLEFFITAMCFIFFGIILFLIGNYRKKSAIKAGKKYKEMGWGKAIGAFFIVMFAIAIVGRIALSVTESSFEGQIKRANKNCPITVAGGTGKITSIKAENNLVVYTLIYDSNSVNLDKMKSSPNTYKKVIVLSSYLLNGQNGNGDKFMEAIMQNKYGISFKIKSNTGDEFEISVSNSELKSLLQEAKQSPTEAMREILLWQIQDESINLPNRIDDDMVLSAILCDSCNLIYRVEIDKPLSISNIRDNNTVEYRMNILKELYSDPTTRANMDMCSVGKFNLIYRYVNQENTDSCDVIFSNSEISKTVRLPKQLNFR